MKKTLMALVALTTLHFIVQAQNNSRPFAGGNQAQNNSRAPAGGNASPSSETARRSTPPLEGKVVIAGSNEPVSNAFVELRTSAGGRGYPNLGIAPSALGPVVLTAATDRDGRFVFPSAPAGNYRLNAAKDGYVRSASVAVTIPSGGPVKVAPLALILGGEISGRVTDRGQPAAAAIVTAFRVSYDKEGRRILSKSLSGYTNDLGEYGIFWLPPGRYYVGALTGTPPTRVGVNMEEDTVLTARYFAYNTNAENSYKRSVLYGPAIGNVDGNPVLAYPPNSPDWRLATIVDIQPGVNARNVNIDTAPLPRRHVRGRITGAPSAGALQVSARPVNDPGLEIAGRVDATGAFDIPVQIPGVYVLTATAGASPAARGARGGRGRGGADSAGGMAFTARREIDFRNADVDGADLYLAPAFRISGAIEIQSLLTNTSSGVGGLSVVLRPDPPMPGAPDYTVARAALREAASSKVVIGRNGPDLRLSLEASFSDLFVPAGDYRVLISPMHTGPPDVIDSEVENTFKTLQGAYVKSITFGNTDVLRNGLHLKEQPDEPLKIVIGTKPATLTGHVTDGKRPVANATVVLIPESGLRFRLYHQLAITDADGGFELTGIAPGDYKAFAWNDVEKYAWQDPDFVGNHEMSGKPMRFEEGESKVDDLKAIEQSETPR